MVERLPSDWSAIESTKSFLLAAIGLLVVVAGLLLADWINAPRSKRRK